LDLRPGRAIKGFLTIMIIMFFFLAGYVKYFPFLIVPNVLAYFNRDLKAKAMMGDTGSNVLGIAIGVIMVLGFSSSLTISGSWLLFLIAIHLLTERYSLTKIIENNKVLNYIDKLGR
jgi:UDP-N-acetylmuramyl pentapeptide phosphotransferase/UDP-N-acetylglucosamine-1-phosphate transferase